MIDLKPSQMSCWGQSGCPLCAGKCGRANTKNCEMKKKKTTIMLYYYNVYTTIHKTMAAIGLLWKRWYTLFNFRLLYLMTACEMKFIYNRRLCWKCHSKFVLFLLVYAYLAKVKPTTHQFGFRHYSLNCIH